MPELPSEDGPGVISGAWLGRSTPRSLGRGRFSERCCFLMYFDHPRSWNRFLYARVLKFEASASREKKKSSTERRLG